MKLQKLLIIPLMLSCLLTSAKKVKFAVNMAGQTISANGVHVSGDFQDEAGYPEDWDSKATPLTREAGTDVYSITVDIPAFRVYQYKYVNGDQFYEVEFVPEKSRVGYDFNDNRWFYLDSASTDTLAMPVLLFGANAPAGKKMIRFKVDMQLAGSIHASGVHLAGDFSAWNFSSNTMNSFDGKVYECLIYVDSTDYEYRFGNGNSPSGKEMISGSCVNGSNNRYVSVFEDTVLEEVCFASCADCAVGIPALPLSTEFAKLSPNPARRRALLSIREQQGPYEISLFDAAGKRVLPPFQLVSGDHEFDLQGFGSGMYFLMIRSDRATTRLKLLVE